MSDFKLPELPSDEALGITREDLEAFEREEAGAAGQPAQPASGGPPPRTPEPKAQDPAGEDLPPRWRGFATLAALVALAWVASIRTGLPDPLPSGAPDTLFAAGRAAPMLEEIAREPRPVGSPEHARVRAYLLDRLNELGLDTEVQTATVVLEGEGFARAATVRNVVARLPGTDPTGAVLLTAHYDGAEVSPAAGDDGSGLVTILEAIRALRAGRPLRNDLVVLVSDAEELGLLGAEGFARDHRWMQDVEAVVGLEMRGAGGPSILFETADGNGAVVRAFRDASSGAFGTSLGDALYRYMPHATDFTVFERAGKQGLNFAAIDNAAVYHTPRDLPSELSPRTLQHHGESALSAVRALGHMDLTESRAPDVVFFSLPGIGLVTYPARWALPLSGALLLLAGGTLFLARRRGARPAAVLVAVGLSIVALSLGYGAGTLLVDRVRPLHAEAGRLPAALFYGEGWYVLALASLALFLVTTLFGLARSRLSLAELALGAIFLPLGAVVAVSAMLPLAAAPLQGAILPALVGICSLALLGPRADGHAAWLLGLLVAAPAVGFIVPTAELLWLAATLRQAGVLGAFLVLGFLLLLPALDALRRPNRWWAPALSLAAAAGGVGLARLGSEVSPVTPVPTTLVYAYERGADRGLWVTDTITARAYGTSSAVGGWLGARVASPFDRRLDLSSVGYRPGEVPVTDAPAAATPSPVLEVRNDTTAGLVRRVTVAVRSETGAERLHFAGAGGAGGTRIVSVNGETLADPFGTRWVDHWGVPEVAVILELEVPSGSAIDLAVSEHHLRPEEILGPGTFQRPPGLEADALRASDRAILTSRLVVPPPVGGTRDVESADDAPPAAEPDLDPGTGPC